jgi:glutamine cyclotransferase
MPAMRIAVAGTQAKAALAVVALLLLAGCGSIGGSPSAILSTAPPAVPIPSLEAEATESPSPEATHIAVASGEQTELPSTTMTVNLDGETNGVTVCAGSVWVAGGHGIDAIVRVDPASGDVGGAIEDGFNLACLDGEPWAAVGGVEIRHVHADTLETVASVPVRTYYVGIGAGSIWAPSGPDVVRIDPKTAEVVATIPIHKYLDVTEVEGNDDAVWATVKSADMVYRIDPSTNTVVTEIPAGAFAHGILVQPEAVWISNAHEDTVTRIDPSTNEALFVDGPGSGVGLAEGNQFVWSSSRDGDLFRIDPATSQAVSLVHVGGWPYGIAATDTMLWVSDGLGSVHGILLSELDE